MENRDKWGIEYLQEIHKKQLKLIGAQSSSRIDNSPPLSLKFSKTHLAAHQTFRNQEFHQIFKKNQVLLEALNEISNRKVRSIQPKTQRSNNPKVQSLNMNYRNQVNRKIFEENEQMLQKLSNKGSTISLKKFDSDFQLSLKYKKNLSKNPAYENQKKDKKKLPKLEYQKKSQETSNHEEASTNKTESKKESDPKKLSQKETDVKSYTEKESSKPESKNEPVEESKESQPTGGSKEDNSPSPGLEESEENASPISVRIVNR